ncbi:MAG: adenosylcobalamin-dependent ribonucleoside-diphosphate reductase [Ignisphaera sp.]|nr:adenosylcobalamin-dependent ribonucleoside-diphosphate reductase [Ignisphaera sp.]MCX8168146.1 adenosylcobalamin-dependent ribonucleoside-diphosphate reductase [Ignisphaera sp.]MDW8085214.1 adenosylcobalamin-dependent ribonucleoside-diphosphate reductase [Ignisphaera sp.]
MSRETLMGTNSTVIAHTNAPNIIVIKRNGSRESFKVDKLVSSILKACNNRCSQSEISEIVNGLIEEIKTHLEISTSELVDRIERIMITRSFEDPKWLEIAKSYELGKIYKDVRGREKIEIDSRDLALTFPAIKVLESRYLLKDPETGRFLETPQTMFKRVAKAMANVEREYCLKLKFNNHNKCSEVAAYWEEKFYELMSSLKFLPNSPTLMNAGTRLGILSACFVIPVRDSIITKDGEGIYDALRAQAVIFQHGGGTGFDFSELRPEGDVVISTAGVASGPVSFMRVFDVNTEIIKQGGKRRGANMGVLHIWHPDVEKFIEVKSGKFKDAALQNFNISVGVYDYFMHAALNGGLVPFVNPRKTKLCTDKGSDSKYYAIVRARDYISNEWVQEEIEKELEANNNRIWLDESVIITLDEAMAIAEENSAITGFVDAKKLFEKIIKSAWDSGDPGLLFIDTINRRHPTWYLGKINSTNPCGEQPLLPWESCNLGSVDISKYVYTNAEGNPRIAWHALAEDLKTIVRFMDDVIDASQWPLAQLELMAKKTRKIGVGIMGWAYMLIKLGIPYDSVDAIYLAYYLAEWLEYNLALASIELAKERGSFPAYITSKYRPTWLTAKPMEELIKIAKIDEKPTQKLLSIISDRPPVDWKFVEELRMKYGIRNATLTSIAPTGTISIIAGTSSGIEPLFAVAYERHVSIGTFIEIDRIFLEYLRNYDLDDPQLIKNIAERGSIEDLFYIPKALKRLFRTSHDIDPKWHLLHQAAWQQWICGGVSKTVNLKFDATVDTVREVYTLAWLLGCKGITVYRDKSKSQQVLYIGVKMSQTLQKDEKVEKMQESKQKFTVMLGESLAEAIEMSAQQGCSTCKY